MLITTPEGMTPEVWLKKCGARFAEMAQSITPDDCKFLAVACFKNIDSDISEDPASCADEFIRTCV